MPTRLLMCLLAMFSALPAWAQGSGEKPDVLLICVDDLNDWVGCMGGHPQALTPNIDRLAKRGVLFTNAHCQAPVCLASRASFMSGKLPSSTGVYLLGPGLRESPELKDAKTLPEWLSDHGYQTMGGGKIFHGGQNKETFQSYGPNANVGPVIRKVEDKLNYKQGHPLWDWGPYPATDEQTPDFKLAAWAVEQLKQKHDKPLFIAVGFNRPHVPMYAPQKWFDMQPPLEEIKLPEVLDSDRDDLPEYGKRLTAGFPAPRHEWMVEHHQWKKAVQSYLACITFVDAQIGKVLDALDESGRADKTVIILLSDHGFHLGEKQRWAKRTLWEESTRVPFIISAPGFEADRRCAQPAGLIDMYPTLMDLCGLASPGGLEGHSLLAQLKDVKAQRPPVLTTWWVGNHTLRDERYRYIRYADGSEELYDHIEDPNEWTNLAGRPDQAQRILAFRKYLPKADHPALPSNVALGVAEEDRAFFNVKH